jgi:hypothetical protein
MLLLLLLLLLLHILLLILLRCTRVRLLLRHFLPKPYGKALRSTRRVLPPFLRTMVAEASKLDGRGVALHAELVCPETPCSQQYGVLMSCF